jgi:hypothetical protein
MEVAIITIRRDALHFRFRLLRACRLSDDTAKSSPLAPNRPFSPQHHHCRSHHRCRPFLRVPVIFSHHRLAYLDGLVDPDDGLAPPEALRS